MREMQRHPDRAARLISQRSIDRCVVLGALGLLGFWQPGPLVAAGPVQAVVKHTAADPLSLARFGSTIAVEGDVAVIGAIGDSTIADCAGAAYVFRRDECGVWTEEQKLLAFDGFQDQLFGSSVAVLDNLILVGAWRDIQNGTESGSVYVYEFDGANWSLDSKIFPLDGSAGDKFGFSVALKLGFGTIRACIGAYLEDDASLESGSVYVFDRIGDGLWEQDGKFQGDDTAMSDSFGWSLDYNGTDIIVGAYLDDDNGNGSGSAYFFRKNLVEEWAQFDKVTASDGGPVDSFGIDVAIDNDIAVVGAHLDDEMGPSAGAAYVFRRIGGAWIEQAKLTAPDGMPDDQLGRRVDVQGDTVIVGAERNSGSHQEMGAVYVFQSVGSQWQFKSKLISPDPDDFEEFGHEVALIDGTALIGAWRDVEVTEFGAVYAFDLSQIDCLGDINLDGVIDTADLGFLIAAFGGASPASDLNEDGIVDTADLGLLIALFGSSCS